jgi:hypothetical protein
MEKSVSVRACGRKFAWLCRMEAIYQPLRAGNLAINRQGKKQAWQGPQRFWGERLVRRPLPVLAFTHFRISNILPQASY